MDALIMAGGRGERMGSKMPKPLIPFNGRPMIEWVLEAAKRCAHINKVYITISRCGEGIEEMVDAEVLVTSGAGYVEDMVSAIRAKALRKTLVLSADLPLLTSSDLACVVERYHRLGTPALAVLVPAALCRRLGLEHTMELNGLVPTGVNIVDGEDLEGEESLYITSNPRFAFNINTPGDLEKALKFVREAQRQA